MCHHNDATSLLLDSYERGLANQPVPVDVRVEEENFCITSSVFVMTKFYNNHTCRWHSGRVELLAYIYLLAIGKKHKCVYFSKAQVFNETTHIKKNP